MRVTAEALCIKQDELADDVIWLRFKGWLSEKKALYS